MQELRSLEKDGDAVKIGEEVARLEAKASQALGEIYAKLTPWQKTQVARHPDRPHASDYIETLINEFTPLAGDRKYAEGPCDRRRVGQISRPRGGDHGQ